MGTCTFSSYWIIRGMSAATSGRPEFRRKLPEWARIALDWSGFLAALAAVALADGHPIVQMQIPVLQERTIWAAVAVAAALAPQKAAPVLLAVPVSVSSAISERKEENT